MEDAAFMIFDYTREKPPEVAKHGFYLGVPASEEDENLVTLTGPFESQDDAMNGLKAMVMTGIAMKLGSDLSFDDEDDA